MAFAFDQINIKLYILNFLSICLLSAGLGSFLTVMMNIATVFVDRPRNNRYKNK